MSYKLGNKFTINNHLEMNSSVAFLGLVKHELRELIIRKTISRIA